MTTIVREHPFRRGAFVVCIVTAALTLLDLSKINVALPGIGTGLGADASTLQLLVVGYAVSFALTLVPAGRFGDARSRRSTFIAGLVAFILVSALCALAFEPWQLLVGRLLQGVIAGILMPQVLGLIQHLSSGPERARSFAILGMVTGLCVALGPTLGGILVTLGGPESGWRLIWFMNIPLGIAVLPFAIRLLPHDIPRHGRADLDPLGTVLLGLGLCCLLTPIVLTTGQGSDLPLRWWLLMPAAALGAAFVLWERHYIRTGQQPLMDVELFRLPTFRLGTTLTTLYFSALPTVLLTFNLFVQDGLHQPAAVAGFLTLPYALIYIGSAAVSSRVSGRMGPTRYAMLGFSIMVLATVLAAIAGVLSAPAFAPVTLALAWGVAGIGLGGLSAQNQTLSLTEVPPAQGGLAGSINQLGQRIGTAIGIAIGSTAYYTAPNPHQGFLRAMLIAAAFGAAAVVIAGVSARRMR